MINWKYFVVFKVPKHGDKIRIEVRNYTRRGITIPMIVRHFVETRCFTWTFETWEECRLEIGHVGARGTDKGDRDSRPSVSVSCLRERNKIVWGGCRRRWRRGRRETRRVEMEGKRIEKSWSTKGGKGRRESFWMPCLLSESRMLSRLGRTLRKRNPVYETLDATCTRTRAHVCG